MCRNTPRKPERILAIRRMELHEAERGSWSVYFLHRKNVSYSIYALPSYTIVFFFCDTCCGLPIQVSPRWPAGQDSRVRITDGLTHIEMQTKMALSFARHRIITHECCNIILKLIIIWSWNTQNIQGALYKFLIVESHSDVRKWM